MIYNIGLINNEKNYIINCYLFENIKKITRNLTPLKITFSRLCL